MFMTGEIVHSSASLSVDSLPRRSAVTGTRKFSVKSSERPTTMKMKAIPKASEPKKCAALGPKCGVMAAVAAASAMMPKTTSKPATSEVVVSSSLDRREPPLALLARAREHLVRLGRLLGLVGLGLGLVVHGPAPRSR